MNTAAIVGILLALVVVGGGLIWYLTARKRRPESLQAKSESESTRTVSEVEIRPLPADQRELFAQQWRAVQETFVDDPAGAVTRADALVEEVMKARGYPVSEFDERAADLSDHQLRFVDNYRAAREIAEGQRRSDVTTEDLRTAIVCYGELFEYLLEDRERAAPNRATDRAVERAVERDVPQAEDDVPITDEHDRTGDNQRRNAANPDVRL
jgi:hypothetical protein